MTMKNEIIRGDEEVGDYEHYTATPADLFRLIHQDPANSANRAAWKRDMSRLRDEEGGRVEWVGGRFAECMTATSWPKGRELMQRYASQLCEIPACRSIRRKRRWSSDGDEFSRDRFDSGYEDCWQARKRATVQGPGRIVDITIKVGGDWTKKAEQLAWGGAAASLLVDRLEDAGYRCSVTACYLGDNIRNVSRPGTPDLSAWTLGLKRADEPLDIDRILMVTAWPAFFRFHWFRWMYEMDTEVTGGLGVVNFSWPLGLKGDVHIGSAYSFEEAKGLLENAIRQFSNQAADVAA